MTFGMISPPKNIRGEIIIMAIHSPESPKWVTMKAVNIAVLVTIARLVPSEVVVKSRSGFSSNFKIDWAAEFPSLASCFIFIRFTETMPISEPEKNASISIPRNTSMRVVAKSISRPEPYLVPFQTMEGKEGSKG